MGGVGWCTATALKGICKGPAVKSGGVQSGTVTDVLLKPPPQPADDQRIPVLVEIDEDRMRELGREQGRRQRSGDGERSDRAGSPGSAGAAEPHHGRPLRRRRGDPGQAGEARSAAEYHPHRTGRVTVTRYLRPIPCILVVLCSACALFRPGPDRSRHFVLTPIAHVERDGREPRRELAVRLGPITFPPYLHRPEVVSRVRTNELRPSPFDFWAGSLNEQFQSALSQNLTLMIGPRKV